MARIPDEELERLKAEVSVEHLVAASGVDLKAAGKDLLGRCPFHEDREATRHRTYRQRHRSHERPAGENTGAVALCRGPYDPQRVPPLPH
jgi:hypothetical protein